jgi:hypothetical protein
MLYGVSTSQGVRNDPLNDCRLLNRNFPLSLKELSG